MGKLFLSLFILLGVTSFSQNPSILWQKTIGGGFDDDLTRIAAPNGSGYYFIGKSNSDISSDKSENSRGLTDIWIVKTDNSYNVVWDKTIGGNNADNTVYAVINNDVIYVLAQSFSGISGEKTMASFGSSDIWLVACDLNGGIIWQKQYGGSGLESTGKILTLSNGNLLLTTLSKSGISGNKTENVIGDKDFWLIEIDPLDGTIIQQKTIGTVTEETLAETIQTSSGTIILKGGAQSGISGDKTDPGYGLEDIWILELDANLNVISDRCFGGSSIETGRLGNIVIDGNFYYISGSSASNVSGNKTAPNQGSWDGMEYSDYWIIKTDLNFNIIWDKTFGGTNDDDLLTIFKNDWNKLVLSGYSYSTISGNKTSPYYGDSDAWLVILNENGDIVTQESYGGLGQDAGIALVETGNFSHLFLNLITTSDISGIKTVPSKGGYDCWFMELDASNFLNTTDIEGHTTSVSVFPNPSNDFVNFKFDQLNESVIIRFYSINGSLITSQNVKSSFVSVELPVTNQIIIYEIQGETFKHTGKLIIN